MTPSEFRQLVRSGQFREPTAGYCGAYAQANLAIIPLQYAADFLLFCQRNPKACPLLGVSEPGQWNIPALGADLDIRNDVPRYVVYRDGELAHDLTTLEFVWREDLVSFAIGCSFSFEQMLLDADILLRHIAERKNVAMYRSNIANKKAGPFGGNMVVSMRPMKAADAIRAVQITSRFPSVHGAPIHLGDPALIGIADLSRPDYGDAVEVKADEIPVFWACGVTPQEAMLSAKLPLAFAHKAGHMLVTDILNHTLAVL
jgi:uncharacterized protein YcsI (UPF0317 family)